MVYNLILITYCVVAVLRFVQLVALENTGDIGIYSLPLYSLRLSCWPILWQETSIIFPSNSFLLLLILKENIRMPTSPAQGRGNTRVSIGNRYLCYCEALMCLHTRWLQAILWGKWAKFELLSYFLMHW